MTNEVEKKISELLTKTLKESSGLDIQITSDMSLIDAGILDSLSIVLVIKAIQSEFDIDICAGDITLDNFDNLTSIVAFVKSRQ